MKKYILFAIIIHLTITVFAQSPVAVQQQKMADAQLLAGTWTGSGWIVMQDGAKHSFNQTEVVTSKMNGGLLTIDGNGKDMQTGAPIHNAFAFFTYDNAKQSYRWMAVSSGFISDVVPEVQPGTLVWSLNIRGGTIRYTISYGTGEWVEKGEISTDTGKTWMQNFEMHLKKS